MMPSSLSGPVANAGSLAGETSAKKPSTLLALDAEPSAAPTRGQPDRHLGSGLEPCRSRPCTLAEVAGKSYGRTASGREITQAMIEEFAAEAGAGYDVDGLIARRAAGRRPTLASGPNPNADD